MQEDSVIWQLRSKPVVGFTKLEPVTFHVAIPWVYFHDYELKISQEMSDKLDDDKFDVYGIINFSAQTMNLFSPLVINTQSIGYQVLNAHGDYSTRDRITLNAVALHRLGT
jgi:flagellar assembly factor FliW